MGTQIMVRMDPVLKAELGRLAQVEGKTSSQVVRELIEGYVHDRDPRSFLEDLWSRIGERMAAEGHGAGDVEGVVAAVRNARR